MGVPTSEVGDTIATTRRKTTKVHKNVMALGEGGKKKEEEEEEEEEEKKVMQQF